MPQLEIRREYIERRHGEQVGIEGEKGLGPQQQCRRSGDKRRRHDPDRYPSLLREPTGAGSPGRRAEGIPELGRSAQARVRVFSQCARDRLRDLGRCLWAHLGERLRGCGEMGRDHRLRRGAGEWREASQHLVTDHGEGVDIRPRIDVALPRRLFRRHVAGRSQREAGVGEPVPAPRLGERSSHAEVGQHGVAAEEQDVLRLDVAVDHALRVRVRQCVGDLV